MGASEIYSFLKWDITRGIKGLGIVILLISFYRIPYIVLVVPGGETILNGVTLLILMLVFISIAGYAVRKKTLPSMIILISLFELSVLPFSISDGFDSSVAIKFYATALYQIGYCWILFVFIQKKDSIWLSAINFLFWALILGNFITIILFPNGLYLTSDNGFEGSAHNWLLGYDNAHAVWFVYGLMFSMLCSLKRTGSQVSLSTVVLYIICLASTIIVQASTSIVAMALIGVYIASCHFLDKVNSFNIRTYLIAYFCVWLLVVMIAVGVASAGNWLSWFVSDILGKDLTFSQRSYIWANALGWIVDSPIVGNGAESNLVLQAKLGNPNGVHNEVLDVMYSGGAIHFVLFLLMLIALTKQMLGAKNTVSSKVIAISILAMFVLQLMRGCADLFWLSMYLMGFYSNEIEQSLKKASVKNTLRMRTSPRL